MTQNKHFALDPFPHTVYTCWGDAGACLYVGCAHDWTSRRVQHAWKKPWWAEVKAVTLEAMPDLAAGLARERELIQILTPKYNIVHNRSEQAAARERAQQERLREREAKRLRCPCCGGPKESWDNYCSPCRSAKGKKWRADHHTPKPKRPPPPCARCGERPKFRNWWCKECTSTYNMHMRAGRSIVKDPL